MSEGTKSELELLHKFWRIWKQAVAISWLSYRLNSSTFYSTQLNTSYRFHSMYLMQLQVPNDWFVFSEQLQREIAGSPVSSDLHSSHFLNGIVPSLAHLVHCSQILIVLWAHHHVTMTSLPCPVDKIKCRVQVIPVNTRRNSSNRLLSVSNKIYSMQSIDSGSTSGNL